MIRCSAWTTSPSRRTWPVSRRSLCFASFKRRWRTATAWREAKSLSMSLKGPSTSSASHVATGASEVARTLRARGVTTVFTLCGDHTNPILEGCDEEGIRLIDARDERGAAWMAAGWALATAEPGVVVVSNTPALTNAATALADSTFSGIPVLCLTGGVGLADRGKGHPGDQDQAAIAAPISKWSVRVEKSEEAAALVDRGCQIAVAPRPGAAVVEIP